MKRLVAPLTVALLLAACGGPAPVRDATVGPEKQPISKSPTPTKKPTAVLKRGGGF